MKASEFRALDEAELDARIRELRGTYFEQSIKRSTGQIENVAELKAMKRDIARALTIQAEKRRAR